MGEQSVGKSLALNHLVDTSFPDSAMRTTEGVWMSVTPTRDALIVALDFEGESCLIFLSLLHFTIILVQVFTILKGPPKRIHYLFCSTLPSPTW